MYDTRFVLAPEAPDDLGERALVRFAVPLPEGEALDRARGVEPVLEGGRIIGVRVDRTALDGRAFHAVFRQPVAHREPSIVGAPIAGGSALQIVDGLVADQRLEIDAQGVLEPHVGYVMPIGVGHAAQAEARRLTGFHQTVASHAIYVRGDDVRAMGGLHPATAAPSSEKTAYVLALVFGAIVLAIVAAVRKLSKSASVERADAILAAEIQREAR